MVEGRGNFASDHSGYPRGNQRPLRPILERLALRQSQEVILVRCEGGSHSIPGKGNEMKRMAGIAVLLMALATSTSAQNLNLNGVTFFIGESESQGEICHYRGGHLDWPHEF